MNLPPLSPVRSPDASPPPVPARIAAPSFEPSAPTESAVATGTSKAAIAFESVVLRTFVEAMLPKEGFGGGTAGHMWRGQMADALAETLARSGGVGIAATLKETT